MSLREELTAHVSVGLMSLVGLALYSGSYSVTMAMGVSSRSHSAPIRFAHEMAT